MQIAPILAQPPQQHHPGEGQHPFLLDKTSKVFLIKVVKNGQKWCFGGLPGSFFGVVRYSLFRKPCLMGHFWHLSNFRIRSPQPSPGTAGPCPPPGGQLSSPKLCPGTSNLKEPGSLKGCVTPMLVDTHRHTCTLRTRCYFI